MASVLRTSFCPTNPHFFTIILEATLRHNKLQIPKRIVRKCGGTLGDQVFFKLPCGLQWKLGLTKSCDGRVWMDKGWPEFSKHYALARGHLLVFRYEGNSQFHVVILDTTTVEIDYPSSNLNRSEKQIGIERQTHSKFVKEEETNDGDEDDNSVENLDVPFKRRCPKTRDKSPLPCLRTHKRMRKSPANGNTQSHQPRDRRPKGKLGSSDEGGGVGENSTAALRLSARDKARALQRVSGFKSRHPFFMLAMQPSYVQAKCSLNVPRHFAISYLGSSKHVILKAPDGRTWSVKYNFKGFNRKSTKPKFESGWKAFVRDNDLKRGDVCVFVLIKSIGSLFFEVSFFRENGITKNPALLPERKAAGFKVERTRLSGKVESGNTTNKKSLTANGTSRALEMASSFKSQNPFFTVVMQSLYANARCNFKIPAQFAKTYIGKNQSHISLFVSDGRSWSVQYILRHRSSGSKAYEFGHGWDAFARGIGLEEGDVCIFELTNRDDISFKVYIVKVGREAYEHPPLDIGSKENKPIRPKSNVGARTSSHLPMKPNTKEELEEVVIEPAGKLKMLKSKENNPGGRISKVSEAANKFCSTNHFQADLHQRTWTRLHWWV